MTDRTCHGRILFAPEHSKSLDPIRLNELEQSFRNWAEASPRADVRTSRLRILLIFLLIRYTGAKLSEVLGVDPLRDIDFKKRWVGFGRMQASSGRPMRRVQLSETLCHSIGAILADPCFHDAPRGSLQVDPGFVRRKFYERAEACGIAKQLGAPEILRKSRAVELLQGNMPLPAVQMLLGHSTPNLTTAYVSFSEGDIRQVTQIFLERESARKTSARNSFFGKIQKIRVGDIQARVELITMGGECVTAVITKDSVQRLGLKEGGLITAEIKAPWVILYNNDGELACSADNLLRGVVEKVTRGEIITEYIVQLADGTRVCSLVTRQSGDRLGSKPGDEIQVVFNSFSVVLRSD